MYTHDNVLAIIPARSGSVGIPHKNIKSFLGKPLISYTIRAALQSTLFKTTMVSTDSREYADLAKSYGAQVPHLRPVHLAHSDTPTSEVTLDILRGYETQGIDYKYFAVLPPTSPLRTAQHIREAFDLLLKKDADVVVSVVQSQEPPMLSNLLPQNGSLLNFVAPEFRNKPRQKLPIYYRIHGAIFFAKSKEYLKNPDMYALDSYAYVMPVEYSVDIDSMYDFYLAETLYKHCIPSEDNEGH